MNTIKYKVILGASIATLLMQSSLLHAHAGHGDELQWQACSLAEKNAPCEYKNSHGDLYRGNCKLFSKALMCVRNEPIIRAKKKTNAVPESTNKVSVSTSTEANL